MRPVLEYAVELWAGDISKELTKKAEAVQISFARTFLGLMDAKAFLMTSYVPSLAWRS